MREREFGKSALAEQPELLVAVKQIYVNKKNVIHKHLNFLCLH